MAPPKKKGFSFRFELSIAGLLGVGVVCFCVFLWMFLLGVWAGQTGLISGGMTFPTQTTVPVPSRVAETKRPATPEPLVVPAPEPVSAAPAEVSTSSGPTLLPPPVASHATGEPEVAAPKPAVSREAESPGTEPAFYTVQVGAFRASKNVEDELRVWRGRGYEPFSKPPGANEHLIKVYIGHYPNVAGARKQAESLAKKGKISPIIVMIKPD